MADAGHHSFGSASLRAAERILLKAAFDGYFRLVGTHADSTRKQGCL